MQDRRHAIKRQNIKPYGTHPLRLLAAPLILLAMLPGIVLAAIWQPEPFNATYVVSMGPMTIGESTRSLSRDSNGNYTLSTSSQATGMASYIVKDQIAERSTWRLANGVIQPLEYRYSRTGGKKEKRERVVFDWKKGIASSSSTQESWQIGIVSPTYDKLLYQMAASQDLYNGKRKLSYDIADDAKIRRYEIAVLGEETISTPLGRYKTIKIKRINDKRDTTLWCSPALGYLPIRIDYVELDGTSFKAVIKTLSGITP